MSPAQRLHTVGWLNGRSILGALLVVVAILAGALFLERAQRLAPVYEAARDLPSGVPLSDRDIAVVRVRLPAAQLQRYARPNRYRPIVGQLLKAPLGQHMLIPSDWLTPSLQQADMVELPIKVDSGDMAQGLHPGDQVQVFAADGDSLRTSQGRLLLPSAEVIRVLEEPNGLTGSRQSGVQVRVPSDRTALVVAAIASTRVFVVKAPSIAGRSAVVTEDPADATHDWPDPSIPAAPPASTEPGTPRSAP